MWFLTVDSYNCEISKDSSLDVRVLTSLEDSTSWSWTWFNFCLKFIHYCCVFTSYSLRVSLSRIVSWILVSSCSLTSFLCKSSHSSLDCANWYRRLSISCCIFICKPPPCTAMSSCLVCYIFSLISSFSFSSSITSLYEFLSLYTTISY